MCSCIVVISIMLYVISYVICCCYVAVLCCMPLCMLFVLVLCIVFVTLAWKNGFAECRSLNQ